MPFKKGSIPWNKDKKGLQVPWNKDKHGVMPIPWNKGKKNTFQHSEEFKEKMSKRVKKLWEEGIYKIRTGEISAHWKGDEVGYRGLHHWIVKELGKADHCEFCGLDKIPKRKIRYFHWANKSHDYKRDLSDWIQLCYICHKKYDKKITHLT